MNIKKYSIKKSLKLLLLIFILSCLFSCIAWAKAEAPPSVVDINKLSLNMRLLEDGRVLVDENINFTVSELIDQVVLVLRNPYEGNSQLQAVEYSGAAIKSDNFVSIPLRDNTIAQNYSYQTSSTLSETELHINIAITEGEHNIHLSYYWPRGITKLNDWAILEGPISSLPPHSYVKSCDLTLQLPESLYVDQIETVKLSSSSFLELNKKDHSVIYKSQEGIKIEADTAFMLTAPRSSFSNLSDVSTNQPIPERLEKAQSKVNLLQRRLQMREFLPLIISILAAASLVLWLIAAILRRQAWNSSKYDKSVDLSLTEAVYLEFLMEGKSKGRDILATLLSLMTKRKLSWEDEIIVWNNPERDDFSQFTPWQAYLLQWLFDPIKDPQPVLAAARLRRETREPEEQINFYDHYKSFQELALQEFNKLGWINKTLTIFKRICFIVLGIIDMAVSLFLAIYAKSLWPLLLLPLGILLLASGRRQFTFTKEGYILYRELRVYINNLSSVKDLIEKNKPELSDVETVISALPHAAVFGKSSEFFDSIRKLDKEEFYRLAYAILHVYRSIPLPSSSKLEAREDKSEEEILAYLEKELDTLERGINIWDALFRGNLIS